jgi:hypothetical protein
MILETGAPFRRAFCGGWGTKSQLTFELVAVSSAFPVNFRTAGFCSFTKTGPRSPRPCLRKPDLNAKLVAESVTDEPQVLSCIRRRMPGPPVSIPLCVETLVPHIP